MIRDPPGVQGSGRRAAAAAEDAHAVLHLRRDPIGADDRARVAQSERLALDYEAPQRTASVLHQLGADRAVLGILAVMLCQRRQRRLQCTSQPAERGGLLLDNLEIERDDAA